MKSEMPKHIRDIYIAALKEKIPLRKLMFNGVINKYNQGRMRAASFISHYIITEKTNDHNGQK